MANSWDEITKEELEQLYYTEKLSDRMIAERYGIPQSKVAYKRKKFDISIRTMCIQQCIDSMPSMFNELNMKSKEYMTNKDNIDEISKAIVQYIFRSGPVEDMHANNQLSQNDMKTLNKFMVNRVAGIITAISDNNWAELELLFSFYRNLSTGWDKVKPDMDEIKAILKHCI